MHGVAVYVAIRMFANIRPPIAMGILISVGVAGLWEVVENMPFIVDSFAKTTRVHGDMGDSVINSMGNMLATGVGVHFAAHAPN